jgi:hypothetical protein
LLAVHYRVWLAGWWQLEDRLQEIEKVGGKGVKGLDLALLDEDWDPEKYEVLAP